MRALILLRLVRCCRNGARKDQIQLFRRRSSPGAVLGTTQVEVMMPLFKFTSMRPAAGDARTMSLLLLGGLVALVAATTPAVAADPAHPTVVELYQSQGCSSCPPVNHNVNILAGRADVIALSFAVTYWDQLGWKDTFAKPAFTQRQWDYARTGGRGQVATPQVIVNGRAVVNGGNAKVLLATVRQADRGASGPAIVAANGRVTIGALAGARAATIWLVRYDPRTVNVPIRAGENGGRTLPHRNIVHTLDQLGTWSGGSKAYKLVHPADPVLRSAILVQEGKGGRIIAATKL